MAHPRNKHERRFLQDNKRARKHSHAQQGRDEAMLQAVGTGEHEDYYERTPHHG